MSEFRYGDDKTIHRTTNLNIEMDATGHIVAVWFRCIALPFDVHVANKQRAKEMEDMYKRHPMPPITAVVVERDADVAQ